MLIANEKTHKRANTMYLSRLQSIPREKKIVFM